MAEKIFVDSFTGGNNGDDLIDCYFKLKNDGTYDFHDKDDHTKCSGLTVGSASPSFQLDEYPDIDWTITLTEPCTDTEVNGNWSSSSAGAAEDQEDGTFQAQAGGGADEEELPAEDKAEQQKIVIDSITSDHGHGRTFGGPLINCYFLLKGAGKYDFCDPLGGVLKRDIQWTDTFDFEYDSQKWRMSSEIHTVENKAHGRWKLIEGIDDEIDGGTFQAQAGGGGGVEETAYTANA